MDAPIVISNVPAQDKKAGNKKTLIIIGVVILSFVIVALFFYFKGRKTTTIAKLPTDDPKTGNQSSTVGNALISQYATGLHTDMSGVNWIGYHDEGPYNDALSLSDTDFVSLYNYFNTKYQDGPSNTLVGWVNSQWAIPYSPFDTVKAAFLQRAGKLNLK